LITPSSPALTLTTEGSWLPWRSIAEPLFSSDASTPWHHP